VHRLFLEVLYKIGSAWQDLKWSAISDVVVALRKEQSASEEAPQFQKTPCFLPMKEDGEGKPHTSMDILCQYVIWETLPCSGNCGVQEVSNVPSPNTASHLSLMGFAVQTNSWAICSAGFSPQLWDCCLPCAANAHHNLLLHSLGESRHVWGRLFSSCEIVGDFSTPELVEVDVSCCRWILQKLLRGGAGKAWKSSDLPQG